MPDETTPKKERTWNPHEDSILRAARGRMTMLELAARFGCSVEDIKARYAFFDTPKPATVPLTPATAEQIEVPFDKVQQSFLELCESYQRVGESLKVFSETLSENLNEAELEKAIRDAYVNAAAMQPGASIHTRLASYLIDRYIIIPRPAPTQTATIHSPTNN